MIGLNVGCGEFYAEGWINIDLPTCPHRKDLIVNVVTDPLPFPNDSIERVYLGHVLEHVSLSLIRTVLREAKRVCSGEVLVVGPDMDRALLGAEGTAHDIEHGGHRWPGDEHLWMPTAALTKMVCSWVFDRVEEIRIADVPEPWPLVSRAPWQCAVLCS